MQSFKVNVQDFVETLKVIVLKDPDLRGLPDYKIDFNLEGHSTLSKVGLVSVELFFSEGESSSCFVQMILR